MSFSTLRAGSDEKLLEGRKGGLSVPSRTCSGYLCIAQYTDYGSGISGIVYRYSVPDLGKFKAMDILL